MMYCVRRKLLKERAGFDFKGENARLVRPQVNL